MLLIRILPLLLSLITTNSLARETHYPESGIGNIEQKLVTGNNHMVATANPYASMAGMRIIDLGGSAVDAAIAVQMVLTLVEPESSGIGGGGFALHWDNKNKKITSYDGREKAPMSATPKLFFDANGTPMNWWAALAGGRSVGVPGIVAMMEKMHKKHGVLPWEELFVDAINLSENGFEVSPKLALAIKNKQNPALGRYKEAWEYFFPNDEPLKAKSIKTNKKLAKTFKRIALLGSKGFYKGEIAIDIVKAVQNAKDNPGLLTNEDLIQYQAIERDVICAKYKKYKLCGMGPPTSGGMSVIQIIKMLEDKNLNKYKPLSAEAVHLITQSSKLAFADRAKYMADSDFVNVPVTGLIDSEYLKKRARLISLNDMGVAQAGIPPNANKNWQKGRTFEQANTTHFSIIDKNGNGISMTSSIEMAFGSTLMVHGFLLNNQLTDFSFNPTKNGKLVANSVAAGKRPRSSMSPFMIFNENNHLIMLIGSPGGSRIINYVAKTILAVLEWDLDIQEAINLPHFVNRNGATDLEINTSIVNLKTNLEKKGHQVNIRDLNSGLQGIVIKNNKLYGGADPRRLGKVLAK